MQEGARLTAIPETIVELRARRARPAICHRRRRVDDEPERAIGLGLELAHE